MRGVPAAAFEVKVVRAAVAAGGDLPTVAAAAQGGAFGVYSLGVAQTPLPSLGLGGCPPVSEGRLEVGMGVHVELGAEEVDEPELLALVALAVDALLAAVETPGRGGLRARHTTGGALDAAAAAPAVVVRRW